MKTLKRGDRGKEVLDIQSRLKSLSFDVGTDGVDGLFGRDTERAVKLFQQRNGLLVDGIIGENTWCELVESRYEKGERLLYLRIPPFRGADVLELQRSLNCLGFNAGPEDGIFGGRTEGAVLDFQKNAGLVMDGMVDASVMKVMDKVTKDGEPHSNEAKIPDRNGGYARGRALSQLTVAIDPGHGGDDPGIETDGMVEKELNLEAGKRLARMLSASGADVLMTRDMDQRVPLYERPAAANHAGADVFISIHQNGNRNPMAQGATAYYFSRQGYYSEAGRVLAGIIVESIGRGMGLPVLPVMGRNYAVLRETEMTAVLVEPLFITASGMGEKEGQDDLAAREAEAIFQGIKDYFE